MKIKPEILDILNQSTIVKDMGFHFLTLPDIQLDRKTYLEVNKVLEAIGGKWNKKHKAHTFQKDPSLEFKQAVEEKQVVISKDEYEFFPTPNAVVKQMIEIALPTEKNMVVLEPSVGEGAILGELIEYMDSSTKFVTHDLNPKVNPEKKFHDSDIEHYVTDFLDCVGSPCFDYIFMNPPFSNSQDVDHITHAFGFLKEGGVLVSVCSESPFFNKYKKSKAFRDLVDTYGESIELPDGSFKESRTMVKTRLVVLRK